MALVVAGGGGCTESRWSVLPYPIPLRLSAAGGGLTARATVDGATAPFTVVVDTGTVLTTYDDGSGRTRGKTGDLEMYGVDAAGDPIPRLSISNVPLFQSPLGTLGVGGDAIPIAGVIGGDNLSRFAVGLDYRGAAPAMTLTTNVTPCSCELAPACDRKESCNAVLPFTLAGGQDTTLQSQTRIAIGNNLYAYPPTRVLMDACLEPYFDPVETVVCAGTDVTNDCAAAPAYLPSGVDVKLIVATGFPGVALSANAYDRLRGAGAAAEILSGPSTQLHLVDPADEGPAGAGVQAAAATLGRAAAAADPGASALALVSTERYFGPCASLARSRRERRYYLTGQSEQCRLDVGRNCANFGGVDPYSTGCSKQNGTNCSDINPDTPVAAVVEIKRPIDVYILPDVTPLLVGINADVRSTQATVDGIIGTALLSRLTTTVDYPGNRVIARCNAGKDECVAYPRLSLPSAIGDCGFCTGGPINLLQCPDGPGYHACPPAP